jgi:DNA-binding phage protein
MPTRKGRKTGFEKYVRSRMDDPAFAKAYEAARAEVDAVDALMRQLDAARRRARLTKADLARQASTPQESVRRLLTAKRSNPALQTVVRLATVVGLQVQLRPIRRRALPAVGTASRSP